MNLERHKQAVQELYRHLEEGDKDKANTIRHFYDVYLAAHDLCTSFRPYMKSHHIQTGVGHYGVFSGKKWNSQIYSRVRGMIYSHSAH